MLASTLRLTARAAVPRVAPVAIYARRYSTAPPSPSASTTPKPAGMELLSPVWTRLTDIVVDKAEGSWIWGTDGRKYLLTIVTYLRQQR